MHDLSEPEGDLLTSGGGSKKSVSSFQRKKNHNESRESTSADQDVQNNIVEAKKNGNTD